MRHQHVSDIEVTMDTRDGTYRLQTFGLQHGKRKPTPQETVYLAESIPAGLRELADKMEQEAARAFGRPR